LRGLHPQPLGFVTGRKPPMPYLAPTGGRNLRRLGCRRRPGCGGVAGLVIADGQGDRRETGQWLPNAEPWTLDEATLTRSFPTGDRKFDPGRLPWERSIP
jgi:hypothetical protein